MPTRSYRSRSAPQIQIVSSRVGALSMSSHRTRPASLVASRIGIIWERANALSMRTPNWVGLRLTSPRTSSSPIAPRIPRIQSNSFRHVASSGSHGLAATHATWSALIVQRAAVLAADHDELATLAPCSRVRSGPAGGEVHDEEDPPEPHEPTSHGSQDHADRAYEEDAEEGAEDPAPGGVAEARAHDARGGRGGGHH